MKLFIIYLLILKLCVRPSEALHQFVIKDIETSYDCRKLAPTGRTCGKCIGQHASCAWCEDLFFGANDTNKFQCDTQENLENNGCKTVAYPLSKAKDTSDSTLTDSQLYPRKVELKLRPGQSVVFNVTFKLKENYPVDIYFLMDVSHSMKRDKKMVADVAEDLVDAITNLTSDARLAFGSFVDKRVTPFFEKKWCKDEACTKCDDTAVEGEADCELAYVFRHSLDFTGNHEAFKKKVEDTKISNSLDSPESGLEAMMQILACQEVLKWRQESRKIIVYVSDEPFHFAGDGKFAGILTPNDEKCKLTFENGQWKLRDEAGYEQDYPSVAQINEKLSDTRTNVIFAVKKKVLDLYQALADVWSQSIHAVAGELEPNSSNFVQLVTEQYKNISKTVELQGELKNKTKDPKVDFSSTLINCDGKMEEDSCAELGPGDSAVFQVRFKLTDLPALEDRVSEWVIKPQGLPDSLEVRIEAIAGCECEKNPGQRPQCSNKGHLICGACECDSSYIGKECECEENVAPQDADTCRRTPESLICSGKGECKCERCECKPIHGEKNLGDFCYCPETCPSGLEGLECSGKGKCICGKCKCDTGYGEACQCSTDNQKECQNKQGVVCSNRGDCECGKCTCYSEDSYKYSGTHCEICEACPDECTRRAKCVTCLFENRNREIDPSPEKVCADKCLHSAIQVDYHTEKPSATYANATKCEVTNQNRPDCFITFFFIEASTTHKVEQISVSSEEKCAANPSLAIAFGTLGAIVLIGLLFALLFKLCRDWHDKRETAQFEKNLQNQKFGTELNPLFKPATTTHENPRYRGAKSPQ